MIDYEFYETPRAFTRYLFRALHELGHPITGTVFEPCVGSGAIIQAVEEMRATGLREPWIVDKWVTNDLDPRWPADAHFDATLERDWSAMFSDWGFPEWTVSNTAFTPAIEIADRALIYSRVGVAMYLRVSIHEVLKTGIRRTWMHRHQPTGILFLPRFAYQRSKTTGKWTTDSASACWVIWLRDRTVPQFIRYAPESVIDDMEYETPAYRARMDALMGRRNGALNAKEDTRERTSPDLL